MPRVRKQQASWSYFAGEKGVNRVRVYEHRPGSLFAEYQQHGRRVRIGLRHNDRTRAKEEADELAAQMRQPNRREPVKIGQLFDMYLREATPTKSASKQQHDRTTMERFRSFWGPDLQADSLTHRDMAAYERNRVRAGDLRPRDKKKEQQHYPLRARSVQYDLRTVRAVLNWGVRSRLLDRNGLAGYKVSNDGTPSRPVFTDAQYRALLEAAAGFPWQFRLLLIIAHETGHRLSALLSLQWRDIDLVNERINWRRENDKIGYEHATPMTLDAKAAFEEARRQAPGIGDAYVLPGVIRSEESISGHLARDWMQRAQAQAGFEPMKGRGYHAFRRNFASELRNASLRDLCDLGGWKDPTTVIRSYQRPSEEAMRSAQARRVALEG